MDQRFRFNDTYHPLIVVGALDEIVERVGLGAILVIVLPDKASRPELGCLGVVLGQLEYLLSMQTKPKLEDVDVKTEKRHLLAHSAVFSGLDSVFVCYLPKFFKRKVGVQL